MVMAARLSGIDAAEISRLSGLIAAAGLPTEPPPIASGRWLETMGMDKKVQNKRLRFVLLARLGDAFVTDDYDDTRLRALLGADD
jgi:3-dehydroquinate synthase